MSARFTSRFFNAGKIALNIASRKTLAVATAGVIAYTAYEPTHCAWPTFFKTEPDYQAIFKEIVDSIEDLDADEPLDGHGSYAPIYVRLAWHSSGTWDGSVGGSSGAGMRFGPEGGWDANKGLQIARDRLESIKKKHPELSYSDLWVLAGIAGVQATGGPTIPFHGGRSDFDVEGDPRCPVKVDLLPDASKDAAHVRKVFGRMGFNDREMVALIGAHCLGSCHIENSGYVGPWTRSPTTFSNDYFRLLFEEKWVPKKTHNGKKWTGPFQYVNENGGDLMLLPIEICFRDDPEFSKWAKLYAKDQDLFFKDFAAAYGRLLELGFNYPKDAKTYYFTI